MDFWLFILLFSLLLCMFENFHDETSNMYVFKYIRPVGFILLKIPSTSMAAACEMLASVTYAVGSAITLGV